MGFYTYNGGLIGTGSITSNTGVHDLAASQHFNTVLISNIFDGMCSYLQSNISEFRNPSFYSYTLDGTSISISDGGSDMYDGGNFTYPWLISGATYSNSGAASTQDATNNINYSNSTSSTTLDTDFVYRTLGYSTSPDYRPLTVLGYRTQPNRVIGFQKSGNLGADGSGSTQSELIYNNSIVNTFTVYSYVRQVYGTSDPSVCDLYMLIGHPKFLSSFGSINTFSAATSDTGGSHLYATSSSNVIAVATLLSKSGGTQVTTAECQTVVGNFTSRMKTYLGF
jgi:hypothetical protein